MDRETTLLMQRAAEKLDHHFNGLAQGVDRKVGFILVVYPYGEGQMHPWSSAARCAVPFVDRIEDAPEQSAIGRWIKEQEGTNG